MTTGTLKGRLVLGDDIQAEIKVTREARFVNTWKRVSGNLRVECRAQKSYQGIQSHQEPKQG